MINFIPNDPSDSVLAMRQVTPRPNRVTGQAGYNFFGQQPEAIYNPKTQAAGFLFWQCREAALAALQAWEDVSGTSFKKWQGNKSKINLLPDNGVDLNAFYDRQSLSFFHFPSGTKMFNSGGSTDVVAHEAGHGILDAIRPDFWTSSVFEVNAFHEGCGDIVAIFTALSDSETRTKILSLLTQKNLAESTAENLAAGIKTVQANHNAALPRRAMNSFKWQLPSSLPAFGSAGDGPGKLINEIHSFGQIISGCIWDTIVNIFKAGGTLTEAGLLKATRTTGKIFAKAVAVAPATARFFRELGRAMVKVDETDNAAANRESIKKAFERHNIPLGTGAMLAPVAALAGAAPTFKAGAVSLVASAKKDLMARLGAVGGKAAMEVVRIGSESVVQVIHERLIPLGDLDDRLKGVLARAPEVTLVGKSGTRAAVLGALPTLEITVDEVQNFVETLLRRGAIDFGGNKPAKKPKGAVAVSPTAPSPSLNPVTHTIKSVGGQKILTRLRFACGCGG